MDKGDERNRQFEAHRFRRNAHHANAHGGSTRVCKIVAPSLPFGARVARQFTSSIAANDLVSEAHIRSYQRVLAGGGPTGAFRPYRYATIRNLARTWGAAATPSG